MGQLTQARRSEVERVQEAAASWAASLSDILGVALVGSWARGQATMASDVDLVILVVDPAPYIETSGWWSFLDDATPLGTRSWGVVTERRVRLESGLEVEFGLAGPAWAECDPVDPGTLAVVQNGMTILYDPLGLLDGLAKASSLA